MTLRKYLFLIMIICLSVVIVRSCAVPATLEQTWHYFPQKATDGPDKVRE